MTINLKRACDDSASGDGSRMLVGRLWPRGVSKEDAALDRWMKEACSQRRLLPMRLRYSGRASL